MQMPGAISGSMKVKCAIAMDSDNEPIEEIVRWMIPDEWRPHVTVAPYAQCTDVIEMVRNALPDLLVIHTNLLLLGPEDAIAGCVAVSPNTRYLLLTAWSEELVDTLRKAYEPLHISLGTLRMPFEREQFIATLGAACGLLT
jgi:hypothetical protein